jgi:hypothetical protein
VWFVLLKSWSYLPSIWGTDMERFTSCVISVCVKCVSLHETKGCLYARSSGKNLILIRNLYLLVEWSATYCVFGYIWPLVISVTLQYYFPFVTARMICVLYENWTFHSIFVFRYCIDAKSACWKRLLTRNFHARFSFSLRIYIGLLYFRLLIYLTQRLLCRAWATERPESWT